MNKELHTDLSQRVDILIIGIESVLSTGTLSKWERFKYNLTLHQLRKAKRNMKDLSLNNGRHKTVSGTKL
jgi:hypothetical protein